LGFFVGLGFGDEEAGADDIARVGVGVAVAVDGPTDAGADEPEPTEGVRVTTGPLGPVECTLGV
jgi:hypothetical protein